MIKFSNFVTEQLKNETGIMNTIIKKVFDKWNRVKPGLKPIGIDTSVIHRHLNTLQQNVHLVRISATNNGEWYIAKIRLDDS